MTPAEVRWRCERIQQLLARMGRREALAEIAAEAIDRPWLHDPRPAHRLPAGPAHIADEPRGIPGLVVW